MPIIKIYTLCEGVDWQASHLTQLLGQISAVTLNMVYFQVNLDHSPNAPTPEDLGDIEWLQLLVET